MAVDPYIFKVIRVARRLVPAPSRARLRSLLFRWLDLRWNFDPQLYARVCNYGDWLIYNEIFVAGEYDRALSIALDLAAAEASPICIVDVGANVGYFTLRTVQQLRRTGMENRGFAITAVEANPRVAGEFRARIFGDNGLADRVTLVEGLVGDRAGAAMFYENSIFDREGYPGVKISYIDLSSLMAPIPRVDLLKCDIEGAELLLLENYPDVFHKVRVAVFEFHPFLCDVERCRRLLTEYGFAHHEMLRTSRDTSIYAVWREMPAAAR